MRALMLALGANAFHQAALIALVPVLQALYGVPLAVLGALVGLGLLVAAAAVPLWGRAAAAAGLRLALSAALTGACAGVVLMGGSLFLVARDLIDATAGFALLAAGRLLFSLSAPALLPLVQSADGLLPARPSGSGGAGRGTLAGHIGRVNAMNGFGRLAGNALIAPLLAFGPWVPAVLPLPVYLAALMVLLRQAGSGGARLKKSPAVMADAANGAPRAALRWRPLSGPLAFGFLLQLAAGASYVLLGPVIASRLGLGAEAAAGAAGFCLAAAVATGLAVQLGLERLVGPRLQLGRLAGAVLCALGLGLLSAANSLLVLAAAASLMAAGVSAALGANTAFTIELGREQNQGGAGGTIAATRLSSVQFAGLAAGAFLGGALGGTDLNGALVVFTIMAALAALPSLAAVLAVGRERRGREPSSSLSLDPVLPTTAVRKGASE
ncbi:MFS transporter [Roseibium litorale]|uniref:MFS transporter n=1 Tax=Roseibium litorale TaxID=2803841 RepID=A0ABR9CRM6_9HYPH|nr:MFS transporter [Roseibium litorale]MBD8893274.1 hypothetical protein [Roseibium litorale]